MPSEGFFGKCEDVLLAARKVLDHDAWQTILSLQSYEPVLKDYKRQQIDPRPIRDEVAPVSSTGRGEWRPDNLEIFGAVGVGADDQRRRAFKGGMVFRIVLNAGLPRGNERRLAIGCEKIDEPLFRGFVIVGRNVAEASRQMAAD